VKRTIGIGLVLMVALVAVAAEPVRLFREKDGSPGKVHPLTLADHNLHPEDGFFYNESHFMIAIADNGYYGYVTFLVSNSGITPKTPGLSFTIVTPDRKRLVKDIDYKPEDLSTSNQKFDLRIKDAYFRETADGFDLKVGDAKLGIELNFVNKVPGFVLGDGRAVFGAEGEDVFYINYPGPRPEFTGKFTVEGKDVPVKGWGYIDHSVTSSNPGNYQEVWHNFKFRADTHTVLISSFTTPDKFEKDFGFGVVTDDGKVICAYTDVKVTELDVKTDPESDKPYPGKVSYEATGAGCKVRATIDCSKPSEKFDVLAKLEQKWWGRVAKTAINAFIAKPWYYRAVAPVEVEITIGEETVKVKGQAFNEVIFTN